MDDEQVKRALERTLKARSAIVEKIGPHEKKKGVGTVGNIDCPICSAKDSLSYSRSGYNGHIHAKCSTDGCVRWME